MTTALIFALSTCIGGLNGLFEGALWWFTASGLAAFILLSAATARTYLRSRVWPVVAAVLAFVFGMTALFTSSSALLFFVPTPASIAQFGVIFSAGNDSIQNQAIPVEADRGIMFLLCAGVGIVAILLDAITLVIRRPLFTGIPLFVVLVIPSLIEPTLSDGFFVALGAIAFLLILYVSAGEARGLGATAVGAAGIALALILPIVLPPVLSPEAANQIGGSYSTGLNPIVNLGKDLRRKSATLLFTYQTNSSSGEYFQLTTFDDLSGVTWQPSPVADAPRVGLAKIGAAPGLGAGIKTEATRTTIEMAAVGGVWLPAPYAPTSVTGVTGNWTWQPETLAIHTDTATVRNQAYTVRSRIVQPTAEQLIAAGSTVDPGYERYLSLPDRMPSIIATTATTVVGSAASNYEKALALQRYFRGGSFTYSTEAPVKAGYDGSGADLIGEFLQAKSGYCVHFASAMAIMARTLGIPSRLVVGTTPGTNQSEHAQESTQYAVSTDDLHAWPELYFSGVGWVRFEPTPGRGEAPSFAPAAPGEPVTPGTERSTSSTPTPTAVPTSTPSAEPTSAASAGGGGNSPFSTKNLPLVLIVILVVFAILLAPLVVRSIRRSIRLSRVRRTGSAKDAWSEINDTGRDLGWQAAAGATPREIADSYLAVLDAAGMAAINRLADALEHTAFARSPGVAADVDVKTVRDQLTQAARVPDRLRAIFLPSSTVPGFLSRRSRVSTSRLPKRR